MKMPQMSFLSTSLSYDVLSIICRHVDAADLASLVLVSRSFAGVSRELLYQNINITVHLHLDDGAKQFKLLHGALKANSELAGLIHSIDFTFTGHFSTGTTIIERVQDMLLQCQNVRTVKISAWAWPNNGAAGILLSLLLFNLNCLRELAISGDISRYGTISIANSTEEENSVISSTSLLRISAEITLDSLKHLLRLSPSLESISCRVPGTPKWETYPGMSHPVSPIHIAKTLEICKTTLKELRLGGASQYWSAHDQTRLDLSQFSNLAELELPSFLLFGSPGPSPSRNGVCRLLPQSLQRLTVFVSCEN
jgi:hypothetical protein